MDFELKFTMRVVRDNKNAFQYYISENLKTIERKSFIDMDPDLFGQLRILCKKIFAPSIQGSNFKPNKKNKGRKKRTHIIQNRKKIFSIRLDE